MLQGLVMDLFPWRLTGLRRAKAKANTKAKDADLLAVNGSILGLLAVDVAEDETTKEKEKGNQRKEQRKERWIQRRKLERQDTALDEWGMIADGTPFLRKLTTDYVDPTGVWPFWPTSNNSHQQVPER